MFGILIPVKGNKNQRLEFQGTLGYPRVLNYFNLLTDRVESSNPAPEVLFAVGSRFLNDAKQCQRHRTFREVVLDRSVFCRMCYHVYCS